MLNESTTITPIHKRILAGATLGWIFDFFDFVLFTMVFHSMAGKLGFTKVQFGEAMGFSLLFTAVGGIVFGYIADKIGRKKALILSISIYSLGGLLTAFTFSFGWLLFSRIITGLGVGGEWGVGQTLLAETTPAKYRGRFGGFMHAGLSIGIIFAYLIGAFLTPVIGWRWTFALAVFAAAIVLPVLWGIPESDRWEQRHKEGKGKEKVELSLIFKGKTKWYALLGLVIMTLEFTGYWMLTTWFPDYLQTSRGMSITKSALWLILLNVGGWIGYASTGILADKFGRRKVLAIYKLIEAIAVLPITLFWTGSVGVLLVCMFFIGFGGGGTAVIGPIFNELFPASVRTTTSNSVFNIARGLQYFTPILAATWAVKVGFGVVLSTSSIFFFIMVLLIWLYPETKGREIV